MRPWAEARTTNWCARWPRGRRRGWAAECGRGGGVGVWGGRGGVGGVWGGGGWGRGVGRARALVEQGAHRVIVGTAAFGKTGVDAAFLRELRDGVGRERVVVALDSKGGRIVVKGWRESTELAAEDVLDALEPYCSGFLCTYVDKEGMMQGTDLEWFRRLRAATDLELTAAGGITTTEEVRALADMGVNAALGMAIYTGKLRLEELAELDAC